MGIKLDWEIEAEEPHMFAAGEDPVTRRARRRARLYVLLVIFAALSLIALVALVIALRLRAVDEQIESLLESVVEAEVTALRIGDKTSFLTFQRSATDDWLNAQEQTFDIYQMLKVERDVRLTGRVLDAVVDGSRARVKVEEIIDGVPYVRLWFYWRYEEGWRHVPPDYTFWGPLDDETSERVQVTFRAVDAEVAATMVAEVESWLVAGCALIDCAGLPRIELTILPDTALTASWSPENPWQLRVPSPLLSRARQDQPFDTTMRLQVANLLADRLVNQATGSMQPQYPADVYYLRAGLVSWLVQRFSGVNTNSFLMTSLANNYSEQAISDLLKLLQADSSVNVLAAVTGLASAEQANLDWRDFLTWRLVLEDELISRGAEASFVTLYSPAYSGVAGVRARLFARS